MVPYPEEIDVFKAPHIRMKQLVDTYLKKVSTTDFTDLTAILEFLPDLQKIFNEFKSHENIENAIIMRKLKSRLEALSINDSTVCNCHSDNSLANMLALVQEGYYTTDYFSYGSQLQTALKDFTDRFLPHMKEEEEVFQPLLIKYFEYEELKRLKTSVVEYHNQWEKYSTDSLEDEVTSVTLELEKLQQPNNPFTNLPLEMELAVFSYLPQSELLKCRRVCRHWREICTHPSLWQEINLPRLLYGHYQRPQFESENCICQRQSFDLYNEDDERESNFISGFITQLLPTIGENVHKLIISGLEGLSSQQLRTIILCCKAVQYLDVSSTFISELAFMSLPNDCLLNLSHLDLSGCCNVNDHALASLSRIWKTSHSKMLSRNGGLKFLSLSGCHEVSDRGLLHLMNCGILLPLIHLDLSGCFLLTGINLQQIVSFCSDLRPENLFYCNNVYEGPYECETNGCKNVDKPKRFCCASRNY